MKDKVWTEPRIPKSKENENWYRKGIIEYLRPEYNPCLKPNRTEFTRADLRTPVSHLPFGEEDPYERLRNEIKIKFRGDEVEPFVKLQDLHSQRMQEAYQRAEAALQTAVVALSVYENARKSRQSRQISLAESMIAARYGLPERSPLVLASQALKEHRAQKPVSKKRAELNSGIPGIIGQLDKYSEF